MRYRLLLTLFITACSRGSTGAHAPLQGGTNGPDAVFVRLAGAGGTAHAYSTPRFLSWTLLSQGGRLYLKRCQLSSTHHHLVCEQHPYLHSRLRTWLRIIHCCMLAVFTLP